MREKYSTHYTWQIVLYIHNNYALDLKYAGNTFHDSLLSTFILQLNRNFV